MEAYGLDKRNECISALKEFDVRDCDIENEPFPYNDNFFDFVFSKSVLEHVVNIDNFLKQSLRVLKPGGMAVMMTPDWKSQHDFFWDDYTHVKAFTRKSLQNAMIINGELIQQLGVELIADSKSEKSYVRLNRTFHVFQN